MESEQMQKNDILTIAWTTLNLFLLIAAIHALCKTIQNFNTINNKKVARFVFYFSSALILNSIVLYSNLIVIGFWVFLQPQQNKQFHKILDYAPTSSAVLYAAQNYWWLISTFSKTIFVFKATSFEISKWLIYFFKLTVILFPMICMSMVLLPIYRGTIVWYILIVLFSLLITLMYAALVAVFLYKLYQAHELDMAEDKALLSIIHKTALLAIVSLITTLIAPISAVVYVRFTNSHTKLFAFISHCLISIDICCKLYCVMLSYSWYDSHYKMLCGRVEMICCCELKRSNQTQKHKNHIELHINRSMTNILRSHSQSDITKTTTAKTQTELGSLPSIDAAQCSDKSDYNTTKASRKPTLVTIESSQTLNYITPVQSQEHSPNLVENKLSGKFHICAAEKDIDSAGNVLTPSLLVDDSNSLANDKWASSTAKTNQYNHKSDETKILDAYYE